MGQKGAWPRSRDLLLNFETPLLSPVRMKLQTSNFAAKSKVGNAKEKKWAEKGRGLSHVTYFCISGLPIISGYDEATNVKFCSQIEGREY